MNNYIMYGHSGSGNHGCEAIVRSTMKLLGQNCILYSNSREQDLKYGLKCKDIRAFSRDMPQNSFRRYYYAIKERVFKSSMSRYKYLYSDFINNINENSTYLSVGGDHYCYGTYSNHIYDFLNDTINAKGGKSILWSCSIEGSDLDSATIESLKRYALITARESITYETLIDKGIANNVRLVPDVAFMLESTPVELPKDFESNNTIGINISPMIQKYGSSGALILESYSNLIKEVLQTTSCKIALIPHVVWSDTDDRVPLQSLYQQYKNTGRILLMPDLPAPQLKYIISQCSFFIGARTHATIAAYSSCVPTLVVGYSVKARGIARDLFGQENEYVIPVQNITDSQSLLKHFMPLWEDRLHIHKHLENIIERYTQPLHSLSYIV